MKKAHRSKTVWFGTLVAVLSVLQSVLLSASMSPVVQAVIGSVLGVAIVWLRFSTHESLGVDDGDQ